jgi:hypothetical protein
MKRAFFATSGANVSALSSGIFSRPFRISTGTKAVLMPLKVSLESISRYSISMC